jgi:hypothetical protein
LMINIAKLFYWKIYQKKYPWHFLTSFLYTFSLYENASLIIFSAETAYISTRSWYRNINFKTLSELKSEFHNRYAQLSEQLKELVKINCLYLYFLSFEYSRFN